MAPSQGSYTVFLPPGNWIDSLWDAFRTRYMDSEEILDALLLHILPDQGGTASPHAVQAMGDSDGCVLIHTVLLQGRALVPGVVVV